MGEPLKVARPRGRPKLEDVAAIEGNLLAVALREFLEHGYGGASMARIVKVLGVSKTTLYSRFSSKEALFRAIVFQQMDSMNPSASLHPKSGHRNLVEGLKSYANDMIELSLQGELLGVNRLIYSESHRFPELGAAAAERSALGIKRIADFISECALADNCPCSDPKGVAEVFILAIRGWYIDVMLDHREISSSARRQWVDRVVHTLLSDRENW